MCKQSQFQSRGLVFSSSEESKKTIYSTIEYFSKIIEFLEKNKLIFEIQYPPHYERNNIFLNEIDLQFLVDIANSFIDDEIKIIVKEKS